MRATHLEYKFRFIIHGLIYMLGFWAPWLLIPRLEEIPFFTPNSLWIVLSTEIARVHLLSVFQAVDALLVIALIFMGVAAALRVWGSAYVGATVVHSGSMHGDAMLADGPYRRTRNPLYLGTLLHTIGIAILMPVSGAVFAIVLIWIFQFRLALAEEPFLAARFGQPYLDYKAAVPRFLPSPKTLVPAAGQQPRWLQAIAGEFYFIAAFVVLAIWGWEFNAQPLKRGIFISLGVWLVIRALLPRKAPEQNATT